MKFLNHLTALLIGSTQLVNYAQAEEFNFEDVPIAAPTRYPTSAVPSSSQPSFVYTSELTIIIIIYRF